MELLTRVARSASTYSVSLVWVAGILLAAGISKGAVTFNFGVLAFTLVAVLAVMAAMLREMRVVHQLVQVQRAELTERIEELTQALKDAGVPIPRQQIRRAGDSVRRRADDSSDSTDYRNRRRPQ